MLQQSAPGVPPVLEPGMSESLFNALRDSARKVESSGIAAVLVVSPSVRGWLSQAVRHRIPDLTVLSYSEIPDDQAVKVVFTVDAEFRNNRQTVS